MIEAVRTGVGATHRSIAFWLVVGKSQCTLEVSFCRECCSAILRPGRRLANTTLNVTLLCYEILRKDSSDET